MSSPIYDRYKTWLSFRCSTCGAGVGKRCITKTGKRATASDSHAARWKKGNRLYEARQQQLS